MIRMWLAFFVCVALLHFGITGFRAMTGKEKWHLTKSIIYSILVSTVAVAILTTLVILF